MKIRFEMTMKVPSITNLREHWADRAKRAKTQREATLYRCPQWTAGPLVVVTLTRIAPRSLDDDNLRGALKSVRDGVASRLKVDDASPLVEWVYRQEHGKLPAVRVEINGAGEERR